MPKEHVQRVDPNKSPEFAVAVGWERDREVQVGVTTEEHLADVLFGGKPELLGRRFAEKLPGSPGWKLVFEEHEDPPRNGNGSTGPSGITVTPDKQRYEMLGEKLLNTVRAGHPLLSERDGIWATLTRSQINDLIRLLRKARDAGYGRDE